MPRQTQPNQSTRSFDLPLLSKLPSLATIEQQAKQLRTLVQGYYPSQVIKVQDEVKPVEVQIRHEDRVMNELIEEVLVNGNANYKHIINNLTKAVDHLKKHGKTRLSQEEIKAIDAYTLNLKRLSNYCEKLSEMLKSAGSFEQKLEILNKDRGLLMLFFSETGLAYNTLGPKLRNQLDAEFKGQNIHNQGFSGIAMKTLQDIPKFGLLTKDIMKKLPAQNPAYDNVNKLDAFFDAAGAKFNKDLDGCQTPKAEEKKSKLRFFRRHH